MFYTSKSEMIKDLGKGEAFIKIASGVAAGEEIYTGYSCDTVSAPEQTGTYTFYEVCNVNNQHVGWMWLKEGDEEK